MPSFELWPAITGLAALTLAAWALMLAVALGRLRWYGPAAAPEPPESQPRVSILLAARNEAATIGRCLASLRQLQYPPAQVEILLGDDASSDATAAVAAAAMQGYPGTFRVVPIRENWGEARGKANVLAHLARAATGEVFFLTDADIAVPPTWLTGLLAYLAPGVGLVTGTTVVQGRSWLARLQGLDWLLSLALVQVLADWGRPVTAMGNNMLVTRAAYEATGGYEALPFSVTEDYALFEAVRARGWAARNVLGPAVLATSLPVTAYRLLHQRRRWLRGVEALPAGLRAALLLYSAYYPAVGVLGWQLGWPVAAGALLLKWGLLGGLAAVAYRRVGQRAPLALLPLFEAYTLVLTVALVGFRLLPLRFSWKGRYYR